MPDIRDRIPARDLILYALDDLEHLPRHSIDELYLNRALANLRAAVKEMPADACHVTNADTRLRAETSLSHIFGEIARRRESQDFKWGGPAHDDTHKLPEWVAFAHAYLCRAQVAGWNTRLTGDYDASLDFEKQMIHVAALAVAAIQSSRRKRNAG